jgi:hypothetical protein
MQLGGDLATSTSGSHNAPTMTTLWQAKVLQQRLNKGNMAENEQSLTLFAKVKDWASKMVLSCGAYWDLFSISHGHNGT